MNPFAQMAATLSAKHATAWGDTSSLSEPGVSRTERIRRLLKTASRPVTAAEIAFDMGDHFPDFGAHLVWLLLKYDIAKGRVRQIRPGLYRWNDDYDTAQAAAIREAVKLLRAAGYKIKEPKP